MRDSGFTEGEASRDCRLRYPSRNEAVELIWVGSLVSRPLPSFPVQLGGSLAEPDSPAFRVRGWLRETSWLEAWGYLPADQKLYF